MKLSFKRPLFYVLLPIFLIVVFVGFPPPFAPPYRTRPKQEQSVQVEKDAMRRPVENL